MAKKLIDYNPHPTPGHNLPFSTKSPRKLLFFGTLILSTGFWLPFLNLRKNLKRQYGG